MYFNSIFDSFQGDNLRNQDGAEIDLPVVLPERPGNPTSWDSWWRTAVSCSQTWENRRSPEVTAAHPPARRPGPCRHMLGSLLPVFLPTLCAFDIRERQGVINIQLCLLTIVSPI